jgi:hypothetical protein
LLVLLYLLPGCATPIGVVRGSTQEMHYALTANVLSAGEPSSWSRQVLHRTNLSERFEDAPAATLDTLHKTLGQLSEDVLQDRLFALAELSFLYAENSAERSHYLAAAVYAYAFLAPESGTRVEPLDPRVRLAADIYNRGVTRGLSTPDDEEVILDPRTVALPFGALVLSSSQEPFADFKLEPGTRELLQESMFFKPVPTLRRVVFIATPHRGSYQPRGGHWISSGALSRYRGPWFHSFKVY